MNSIYFLFDAKRKFLGEVAISNGAFLSVILTSQGENVLGPVVKEWQTMGIEIYNQETIREKDGTSFKLFKQRVSPRDANFLNALNEWMMESDFELIHVPDHVLGCWQLMLSLPLSDEERFVMIYAFCRVPKTEIETWRQALEQSLKAVEKLT